MSFVRIWKGGSFCCERFKGYNKKYGHYIKKIVFWGSGADVSGGAF